VSVVVCGNVLIYFPDIYLFTIAYIHPFINAAGNIWQEDFKREFNITSLELLCWQTNNMLEINSQKEQSQHLLLNREFMNFLFYFLVASYRS
jgi:hypothetical protein